MISKIINGNILVFRISEKGEIGSLNIPGDVKNFVADMTKVDISMVNMIKKNLIKFGKSINKGTFVVVSQYDFEEELNIVPTMQEAFDFIEMEEIERQLNF